MRFPMAYNPDENESPDDAISPVRAADPELVNSQRLLMCNMDQQ
jgi:hypothetical protein